VVVDASVAVKWFLPEPGSDAARWFRDTDAVELHVPDLWYLEIGNALWKRAMRSDQRVSPDVVRAMLGDLRGVGVTTHGSAQIVERAAALALEAGSTVYDASYAAVAERAQATLVTADARLARDLAGHTTAPIELLEQGDLSSGGDYS
jgi:predicted nucleic acid-binding protein